MRLLFLFICICSYVVCLGQIPGYQGKKTLITLSADLSPALRITSKRRIDPYLLNIRGVATVEQVLTRNVAVGFSFNPLITEADYELANEKGLASIRGVGVGLNASLYSFGRIGNIAPLGPFTQLELDYYSYWMVDKNATFYPDRRRWLGRFGDMGIGLLFGNRHLFGDIVSLQYGIRLATVLGLKNNRFSENEKYLKNLATDRLQGQFFINASLGAGIMIR